MLLTLENIGKVRNASVEIDGITVIAGENNTGKSTVGKVLYSIFNSFYRLDDKVLRERQSSIERVLDQLQRMASRRANVTVRYSSSSISSRKLAHDLVQYVSNYHVLENEVREFLNCMGDRDGNQVIYDDGLVEEAVNRIRQIMDISDDEIVKQVLTNSLNAEFNNQINNIYHEDAGTIQLKIRSDSAVVEVAGDEVLHISHLLGLETEAVYIDDPFVIDELNRGPFRARYGDHRTHLSSLLSGRVERASVVDEIITNKKLSIVYDTLDNICGGEIVTETGSRPGYKMPGQDKVLDIRNISTGLKTFVILKMLLQNGSLDTKGTIVLDEPEIHLHPEWQLLFAELIVLIQKEFDMHILLNTHSPYFLNAIEVYSSKHGVANRCHYYLAKMNDDASVIEDVSGRTDEIYAQLARPLQVLENEMYLYG